MCNPVTSSSVVYDVPGFYAVRVCNVCREPVGWYFREYQLTGAIYEDPEMLLDCFELSEFERHRLQTAVKQGKPYTEPQKQLFKDLAKAVAKRVKEREYGRQQSRNTKETRRRNISEALESISERSLF